MGLMLLTHKKGFSMLEMVLVLILIAIITIIAIPSITDITDNAKERQADGYVNAIRSGIQIYWANSGLENDGNASFPDSLDSASSGMCNTTTNQCFTEVLESVTGDPDSNMIPWRKEHDGEYVFVMGDPIEYTYTYDSSTGKFEKQ